jgi:iron complex outermembrane recepter protein
MNWLNRIAITSGMVSLLLAGVFPSQAHAQDASGEGDALMELSRMTLEQLANVEITSVSKSAQSLSSAPASVYVITREEILRSGVLSVPEALRLAPNLQIAQFSATDYEIGARGFGSNREAQNFSNKILILIDGRSVYNPLFSGVTYDALDVLMDDIDRIEVISGPGATLWGSNAMNGVINIITRSAVDSQGSLLHASAGQQESALAARHGGLFKGGAWRVYGKALDRGPSELADGSSAGDRWRRAQGGFRADFSGETNEFTVQGDVQRATFNKGAAPEVDLSQFNLLGRWQHTGERATTRVQLYFDRTDRGRPPGGVGFDLNTYDIELQQTLQFGSRHRVVWGLGRRYNDYDIENTPGLFFLPPSRKLSLTNVFAQDAVALTEAFTLTAGIKFEENSYSGWSTLPDLRLSWAPDENSLVWAAASRAVRSPTPFDVDVRESFGGPPVLFGDPDFKTEKVWAYEIGYRNQPHSSVSWSVSTFYDDYDDLRTIEITPVTFFPLSWANLLEGSTYGVEIWGNWQATDWWRLSPGFRSLHKRLRFSEGASGVLGVHQAGNDPRSQGSLKSSMTFGRLTFDAQLRYVGELPSPEMADYTEMSARLSWQATDELELSLTGFNLLDDSHLEYAAPTGNRIRRSVFAEARVHF